MVTKAKFHQSTFFAQPLLCSTGSLENIHSNVCDSGYSICAEENRRHTNYWCRAVADDALNGLFQN